MRRRPLLHLALAAAFTLFGASCLSPTLPLPPPDVGSIQDTMDGAWTIAGDCKPGAIVTVFNDTQAQGVVVEDRDRTGRFAVRLKADLCDLGWASQQVGNEGSDVSNFVVAPHSPNDTGAFSNCPPP